MRICKKRRKNQISDFYMPRNIILAIILFISFSPIAKAQFNKYEKSDTIFKSYKAPIVDRKIYERLERDDAIAYFTCYIMTDTSGKVSSQRVLPLYNVGNGYNANDTLWESISEAIRTASKHWVLKLYTWQFEGDKTLEISVNKSPFQRPFGGKPRYLLIFEISGINSTSIDKIGFINSFQISK